jgi:hypothetical protein
LYVTSALEAHVLPLAFGLLSCLLTDRRALHHAHGIVAGQHVPQVRSGQLQLHPRHAPLLRSAQVGGHPSPAVIAAATSPLGCGSVATPRATTRAVVPPPPPRVMTLCTRPTPVGRVCFCCDVAGNDVFALCLPSLETAHSAPRQGQHFTKRQIWCSAQQACVRVGVQ